MRKPKITADEGIHRAFVRARKAEGKAGAGKRGFRAQATVGWDLDAVSAPQATGAALQYLVRAREAGTHESLVDGMVLAVALVALVFGALMLLHH